MRKIGLMLAGALLPFGLLVPQSAGAAEYRIDPAHSFVQFRIKHLGVSWLLGRFNDIGGELS